MGNPHTRGGNWERDVGDVASATWDALGSLQGSLGSCDVGAQASIAGGVGIIEHTSIRGSGPLGTGPATQWNSALGWRDIALQPNQHTGPRTPVVARGMAAQRAGRIFGHAAVGISMAEAGYHVSQGDYQAAGMSGLDAAFGMAGFAGPLGFTASMVWFSYRFLTAC